MSGASTSSRDLILAALEASQVPPVASRAPFVPPPMPEAPEAVLGDRLASNGGRLVRAPATSWCDAVEWPAALESLEHVFVGAGLEGLAGADPRCPTSRGVARSAASGPELEPLEVSVLRAQFAVVENGAAWVVPSGPIERSAALLARHLIVLVPADALVATLHEAYARLDLEATSFGWFLAGPSKTADIEQAMVLGAHGAITMQLVLIDGDVEG